MAEGQPPLPLATIVAVAAAAGAMGFGIAYYFTAEAPRAAERPSDGHGGEQPAKAAWRITWPWTTRTASQQAGACVQLSRAAGE